MALFVQQSGEASRCLSPATRDELSGQADYVLHGNDGRALAAEAKCICVDVSKGRQQAKRCADNIEKQRGCRPVIFLTNGFDTRIRAGQYPERKCAAICCKRDPEKWFNLLRMRSHSNKPLRTCTCGRAFCMCYRSSRK